MSIKSLQSIILLAVFLSASSFVFAEKPIPLRKGKSDGGGKSLPLVAAEASLNDFNSCITISSFVDLGSVTIAVLDQATGLPIVTDVALLLTGDTKDVIFPNALDPGNYLLLITGNNLELIGEFVVE